MVYSYTFLTGGGCLRLNTLSLIHLTIPVIGLTATITKICFNHKFVCSIAKTILQWKIQYFTSSSKFNVGYVKCMTNVLCEFSEKFLKFHSKIFLPESFFKKSCKAEDCPLLEKIFHSGKGVLMWILRNFSEQLFRRTLPRHYRFFSFFSFFLFFAFEHSRPD